MGRAGVASLIAAAVLTAGPARAQPPADDRVSDGEPSGDDEAVADAAFARVVTAEPDVIAVRAAALRWHHLAGDPVAGWARRARWAAALPHLSLRARRSTGTDRDLSRQSGGSQRLDSSLGVDVWLEARATWDLDRLVFDERELRAAEVGRRRRELGDAVARRVTTLYYRRRRLQVTLLYEPPESAAARARLRIEIDELAARLDALTGGWFGRRRRPGARRLR